MAKNDQLASTGSRRHAPGLLLREIPTNPDNLPETRAARRFRTFFEERGKAEGKRDALHEVLLQVLAARGLAARGLVPTDEVQATIAAREDADLLRQWTVRAATAGSVAEVLTGTARG